MLFPVCLMFDDTVYAFSFDSEEVFCMLSSDKN
jgi:hypothetical protein